MVLSWLDALVAARDPAPCLLSHEAEAFPVDPTTASEFLALPESVDPQRWITTVPAPFLGADEKYLCLGHDSLSSDDPLI